MINLLRSSLNHSPLFISELELYRQSLFSQGFIFTIPFCVRRAAVIKKTTANQSSNLGESSMSHTASVSDPINTSRRRLKAVRSVLSAQRSALIMR